MTTDVVTEVLDKFNFEKVRAIMTLTGHTYRGEENTPDINHLYGTAFWCVNEVYKSEKESCTASTGGFLAVKIYNEISLYWYADMSRVGLY